MGKAVVVKSNSNSVLKDGKPTKTKLHRYILLKIVNVFGEEGVDFKTLEQLSGLKAKDIVTAVNALLYWRGMKRVEGKYILNGKGRKLLKYYEENYGAKDWWEPPLEVKLREEFLYQ